MSSKILKPRRLMCKIWNLYCCTKVFQKYLNSKHTMVISHVRSKKVESYLDWMWWRNISKTRPRSRLSGNPWLIPPLWSQIRLLWARSSSLEPWAQGPSFGESKIFWLHRKVTTLNPLSLSMVRFTSASTSTWAHTNHKTSIRWLEILAANKLSGLLTKSSWKLGKMEWLDFPQLTLPWGSLSRRDGFIILEDILLPAFWLGVISGCTGSWEPRSLRSICSMQIGLWTTLIGSGWAPVDFSISTLEYTLQ